MNLVRDVLDNQLRDSTGRKFGRIDGLVLEARDGQAPRLLAIEMGAPVLARRISPRWEHLALRLGRLLGVRREAIYRISWENVRRVDLDVELDFDGKDAPPLDWERWLRDHVWMRLPFA